MKVLVTGAAGFIGGQLWHTLWQRGDEVVGIDNVRWLPKQRPILLKVKSVLNLAEYKYICRKYSLFSLTLQ